MDDVSESLGMIAIQGPMAEEIVAGLTETDLSGLDPFRCLRATVAGLPVLVARTGYTGEDGFEFYVPQDRTAALWDALMAAGTPRGLKPIGLEPAIPCALKRACRCMGTSSRTISARSRPVSVGPSSSTRDHSSAVTPLPRSRNQGPRGARSGFSCWSEPVRQDTATR